MKITIGSDHRGFGLKEIIKKHFSDTEWVDVGTTDSEQRVDYPVFAKSVCKNVLEKTADLGILICGSGVGMSIAANRFPKIYAALCWNTEVACAAKNHDSANVLILPADFVANDEAVEIVQTWLKSEFLGDRYLDRLKIIDSK
jgi:RpiB/LacA/LacB family sugar-phosphate isomerase